MWTVTYRDRNGFMGYVELQARNRADCARQVRAMFPGGTMVDVVAYRFPGS